MLGAIRNGAESRMCTVFAICICIFGVVNLVPALSVKADDGISLSSFLSSAV